MNSKIFSAAMIVMMSVSAYAIGGKDLDKKSEDRARESVIVREGTASTANGNRDMRVQSIAAKVGEVARASDSEKCDDVCKLRAQILEGAEHSNSLSPATKAHVDSIVLKSASGIKANQSAGGALEQALSSNEFSDTEKDEICGH